MGNNRYAVYLNKVLDEMLERQKDHETLLNQMLSFKSAHKYSMQY